MRIETEYDYRYVQKHLDSFNDFGEKVGSGFNSIGKFIYKNLKVGIIILIFGSIAFFSAMISNTFKFKLK